MKQHPFQETSNNTAACEITFCRNGRLIAPALNSTLITCAQVHTHARTHTRTHTHTHARTHIHTHAHTYTTHAHTHTYAHTNVLFRKDSFLYYSRILSGPFFSVSSIIILQSFAFSNSVIRAVCPQCINLLIFSEEYNL